MFPDETALADKLGVIQQTVNAWITDIRARQKTNRDSIIIRLSRLGWTQEKIAETTKMTQGRIAQIINNTSFGKINNLVNQNRNMKYIAGHYNMERALAWALSGDLVPWTPWQAAALFRSMPCF
jgi:plasmid maintenance system antidote protein VapI